MQNEFFNQCPPNVQLQFLVWRIENIWDRVLHKVDVFPAGQHQLLGDVEWDVGIFENDAQIFMPNGQWLGCDEAIGDILEFNDIHRDQIVGNEIHITLRDIRRFIHQLYHQKKRNQIKLRNEMVWSSFTSMKNFDIFMIFSAESFMFGKTTSISMFGFEKNTNAVIISVM